MLKRASRGHSNPAASLLESLEPRRLMSAAPTVFSALSFGGSADDRVIATATDAAGFTYVVGFFQSTININGTQLTSNGANDDIFVAKFAALNSLEWAFSIGSTTGDEPTNLLVDAAGSLYLSGFYSSNIDVDPGAGTHTLTANGVFNSDAFLAKYDTSGNFQWASAVSGPSYDTAGKVLLDPSTGNILWNGTFTGTVTFSGGLNSTQLSAVSNQGDPFLARFDSAGTLVNVTQNFSASAVDAAGNIYTAWNLSAPADIDPGANTLTVTPTGSYGISFAKYDSALNLLWHKDINGVYAAVYDLTLDSQNNLIAVGDFAQSFQFDPAGRAPVMHEPASPDSFSSFVLKLDSSGKYQWVTAVKGQNGWSDSWAVKIDALNNIYVAGDFNGRVNFSRNTVATRLAQGNDDAFLAAYSAAGNLKWVKTLGGSTYDRATTLALSSDNLITIAGYISGSVTTNAGTLATDGSNDAFVAYILPPRGPNQLPVGHFDVATSTLITGYALDPDGGNAMISISILIDGHLANMQTASISRPDLVPAQNFPFRDSNHGFSYVPPVLKKGWHNIAIYAADINTNKTYLVTRKLIYFP